MSASPIIKQGLNAIIIGGVVVCGILLNDLRREHAQKAEEARLFSPVTHSYVATAWKPEQGGWSAHITAVKEVRPECELRRVPKTALVLSADRVLPVESNITFLKDDSPDSDRPAGHQSFGRWLFTGVNEKDVLTTEASHTCKKEIVKSPIGPLVVGVDGVEELHAYVEETL